MEVLTNRRIIAMRFDGGTEYKKVVFCGIVQQISAPYTQHQNDVSERMNRTLVTVARCMLLHADLPLRFWDAAILTASYLRNRLPSLADKKTPYEYMNGTLPSISHLKVWGCLCYTLIDEKDPQRYKLSPTSQKGKFIGYCESTTQYRVYIPLKKGRDKVIFSAYVRFLEDKFWDWEKSFTEQFDDQTELLENPYNRTSNNFDSESSSDTDTNSMDPFTHACPAPTSPSSSDASLPPLQESYDDMNAENALWPENNLPE
ncbi:hypothetical protein K3495_g1467 [Podosphaera aphanis]|nr:hypothetical protein K3495_g1467 [Podosphaera aphanis]